MKGILNVKVDLDDTESGHKVTVEVRLFKLLIGRKEQVFMDALFG